MPGAASLPSGEIVLYDNNVQNPIGGEPGMMRRLVVLFLLLAVAAPTAMAQSWPAKSVRMVVLFPPGGGVDLTARALGRKLGDIWGQPVVVENKPGAGATIGANTVATSPEDGYTLLLTNNALAISAGLYSTLPYDALKDLRPVSTVLATPFVFVVPATERFPNLGALLREAKQQPGELTYASTGIGSGPQLAMVLLTQMTGTEMRHVPYKGGGQAIPDLVAGRVEAFLTTPLAAMPHVQAGKLRALGVTSAARMKQFGDIPTLAEAGVPGYEVETWYMVLGPAKLAPSVAQKLHQDIVVALKDPSVRKVLEGEGATLLGTSPKEASELLAADIARWSAVIQKAGVKPTD